MGRTKTYAFCLLAALAAGCPDSQPMERVPWPNANTVGFAGADISIVSAHEGYGSHIWENGRARGLYPFRASSVFASGGDVYVAGYEAERYTQDYQSLERSYAAIWKDGAVERVGAANTQALSVFVAEGTIYAAGQRWDQYPSNGRAMLWVNDEAAPLGEADVKSCANSVFVSNGNVYVAGHENGTATLWVNGRATHLADGGYGAEAHSVYVSGGDVYVAGKEFGPFYVPRPTYAVLWKNGEPTRLAEGRDTSANSVYVSGGDVHVAGMHGYLPALWKNGAAQRLDNPREFMGRANSVSALGGDVYVAGEMYHHPILWKNGAAYWLDGLETQPLSISVVAK